MIPQKPFQYMWRPRYIYDHILTLVTHNNVIKPFFYKFKNSNNIIFFKKKKKNIYKTTHKSKRTFIFFYFYIYIYLIKVKV